MKIRTWTPAMSPEETKDLAYWERNMLALRYAEGWYNDDTMGSDTCGLTPVAPWAPRYPGWRRVLSLANGRITFHIPDDFEVGNLPEIAPNWDGHTTEEKWRAVARTRGVAVEKTI